MGPDGCPIPLQVRYQSSRPERRTVLFSHPQTTRRLAVAVVGVGVGGRCCLQSRFPHAPGQTLPGGPPLPTWASSPWPHRISTALQGEQDPPVVGAGPGWPGRRPAPTTPLRSVAGGPALPREPLPPRPRKWPCTAPGAGRRARAAGNAPGWRKRAQEARLAAAGAVYPAAHPPTPPNHTHFHFLPASPAGAAYLTDRLRPSELTFQARAGCCGGKAITPLYKNKTKIDRCRLALLPRTSPRRGWGWIEASEELLGRDSRGLPTRPRVTRKVRAKQPTPPRVPSRPRRREPYLSGSVTASTHQGLTTEKGKHTALFANKRPDSRLREDGGGGGKRGGP